MNEEIKNPNQLDLFEGILRTPEQEKMINDFLERQKTSVKLNTIANQQNEKLLIDNGFIFGMDFVNTFKVETVTKEVTLGYRYDNTNFEVELTYETPTGYISLKGKRFTQDKLTDDTFGVSFERDKVQCLTIQDQYRYIKPTTMLDKLKVYNSRQETLFEEYKKKTSLKQTVIEKYTKLYPNATITAKTDWTKYNGHFDIIEVKFESGSYVQFKLDTYKNEEYIYKKHDAKFDRMKADELLERFSKQEALN